MKKLGQLLNRKSEDPYVGKDCMLALVGTGGAGKTSIIKRISAPIKRNEDELRNMIHSLLLSVLIAGKIEELENVFEIKENSNNYLALIEQIGKSEVHLLAPNRIWDDKIEQIVFNIHQDPGFQNALFENRAKIPFLESIKYFALKENITRMQKQKQFKFTIDDYFFISTKTVGISPFQFCKDKKKLLIDTAGQRNERRKWNSIPDDVTKMVIGYVISLSEFDELCYEDEITNRFQEGLSTFEKWYDSKLLSDHPLYLIFNKYDVLENKIRKGVSFSQFIPEYKGNDESNVDRIVEFIVKKYLAIDVKGKVVKHFVISCLKTEQVIQMATEIFKENQ